jgi:hypothetical protein
MAVPSVLGLRRFDQLARRFVVLSNRTRLPGRPWAIGIYSITLLPVLLLLGGLWFQPYVPLGELMRDSLLVAEVSEDCCHIYYGAVSNLGVLIWAGGSAILFFAAIVVALLGAHAHRAYLVQFVLAGILTALLCVDDFFLIHDIVLPKLGFSEMLAYAVYAAFAMVYVFTARNEILAARWPMFLVSVFCLALSVEIDVFMNIDSDFRLLVEDGAKLMGIVAWFSFHTEAAACTLQRLYQVGSGLPETARYA